MLTELLRAQVQAVKSAEETAKMNETELQELDKTIKNIEAARPFEECTVVGARRHIQSFQLAAS